MRSGKYCCTAEVEWLVMHAASVYVCLVVCRNLARRAPQLLSLRRVSEQPVLSTGLTTTQALKLTSVDVLINLFTW